MPRQNRSDKDLLKFIDEHLGYELWMLARTTQILKAESAVDRETNNAVLQSLCLHARNLLEFFYSAKRTVRNGDAVAEDYFASPDAWHHICPQKSFDGLRMIYKRVGEEIAHLTYGRLDVVKKGWDSSALYKDISNVARIFLENAQSHLIGPKCHAVRNKCFSEYNRGTKGDGSGFDL